MTAPYYTATAGPADPKAPFAAKAYTVVSGLLGLVAIASTFGVITQEQGAALGGLGTAATGLVGAGITAIAAFRTTKQVKNGTFDKAPELPSVPALEQLAILRDQAAFEVDRAVSTVQLGVGTIQSAVSALPGGKPVGDAIGSGANILDDLLRSVTSLNTKQ